MKSIPDDQFIASYISGECTEEERKVVEAWLQSNPENQEYFDKLTRVWSPKKQPTVWDKDQLWLRIRDAAGLQQVPIPVKSRIPFSPYVRRSRILLAAAGVLLAVSVSYFAYMTISGNPAQRPSDIKLTVKNGTQEKLTLSDGTVVTLDAGSAFTYPAEFTGRTREVILHGEGYFEIAPEASKPFIVRVDEAMIQVLGTKFAVRSWWLDRSVQVAVVEGRVQLSTKRAGPQGAVVITGGQVAAVLEGGKVQSPQSVDIDPYLGWLNHDIGFTDTSLEEILFHLERWYDVEFVLENSALARERLTVHTRKKSIDAILDMIAILTDLNYRRSGKTIYLFTS
ncbi:MAG: FecR domain-containing protein [Fidelibacterota bacterium]|nr:MAG: FecR domain-containing protein [Candidatus Neomarinimicrobiota bacterium]